MTKCKRGSIREEKKLLWRRPVRDMFGVWYFARPWCNTKERFMLENADWKSSYGAWESREEPEVYND